MIIDPTQVFKETTTRALLPTHTPTDVPGIPTVLPPRPDYQEAHDGGKVTLWVVFAIMLLSSAVFAGMAWRVPVSKRVYHVITTLITIIASISYFAMATGHGASFHHIRVRHSNDHVPDTYDDVYRQIFWARYVDWALTTPLLLLDLSILAGLSGAYTLMAILADVIMVLTGLFAAYGQEDTPQKWGWYAIAIISYLVVIWHVALNGRSYANAKGSKVGAFFTSIAAYTLIIWTAYPIVWAFGDGARKMSVNAEIITYGVLDILAKVVFGAWLLGTHANMPESNVELGGFWTNGLSREGALRIGDDNEA
ncbi:family A G protein-coupled receptor-like protein [Delitschia confertaspora ATCC 74209]|uniref:Family A G protein-coupled receptor-like protein n=1 Tax=Delitschia confertaspora ATCC 74209 TaxID=1513339 RepID=A0A9P4JN67_9PLEO|nr:family A G protein-coupled receptor-like protein [Delitschia confertaspora ATCC 74209]